MFPFVVLRMHWGRLNEFAEEEMRVIIFQNYIYIYFRAIQKSHW